jgi:protein O-mannosyl-transferase
MRSEHSLKISPVIPVILLLLAIFLLYGQVRNFDFIILDDFSYALNPWVQRGFTFDGVWWAFTSFDVETANWHPLTWFSLMMDRQLYGMNAGGYHLTNMLIHMANTVLLFIVLRRLTDTLWRSAFVAFLFAVHPLHIESVVWISERKDLLCAFFWILATAGYLKYVERLHLIWYAFTILLFALALMSKPMAVTFPFVLLLLDYWPLRRFQQRHDSTNDITKDRGAPSVHRRSHYRTLFLEKAPLMVLSLISSIITFMAQQTAGAVQSLSLSQKVSNVVEAYCTYIIKMLWPHDLGIVYPLSFTWPAWHIVTAASLMVFITAMIIRFSNKYPYLFTGWFWFVGTLIPVIGLVQVGGQHMADRYTYMPMTGLFIIISWGAADMVSHKKSLRYAFNAFTVFWVCILMMVSWFQIQNWSNSLKLLQHTLSVTRYNDLAHNYMGIALRLNGDLRGAESHFKEALRISPGFAFAHRNLGIVYRELHELDLAASHLREAIKISPRFAEAHNDLGLVYYMQNHYAEAISEYSIALSEKKDFADAYDNRAGLYLMHGKKDSGCHDARKACLLGNCNSLNWSKGVGYCP